MDRIRMFKERNRSPIVVLILEIFIVHNSFIIGWTFLSPYLSHYLPDYQPLLFTIWSRVLEPYAVSLLSIPSIVVLLIMLCYIAAKQRAMDIFNVEAEPLTRFVMEFKEDLISLQDISTLRFHLHAYGVLTGDEMLRLNNLRPHINRYDQVYQLLSILNHKSNGPFKLIEILQNMSSEHNFIGEIADVLIKEYCDDCPVKLLRRGEGLYCSHDLPGIESHKLEVFTITTKLEKITWKHCGLSLNIPEEAIVKDGRYNKTLQVQVSVGFGGQIRHPCDGDLQSGIYCLTIKGGVLTKPIKAEVQHCAAELQRGEESSVLQFVTENVTESSTLAYVLAPQHDFTSFSCMSANGTIDLHGQLLTKRDQGIIFAVCSKTKGVLSRYCARIFYKNMHRAVGEWSAHITIAKDLEICSKLVDEVYSSGEWYTDSNEVVPLCLMDSLTLSLDHEGIRFGGWHISPTSSLTLSKSSLESFYKSKRIPHFTLRLRWIGPIEQCSCDHATQVLCSPSVLSYKVPVEGTVEPHVCTSLHIYLKNRFLDEHYVNMLN